MDKKELIKTVATASGCTHEESKKMVDTVLGVMADTLAKNESVRIPDFGIFEYRTRKERNGVNPKTGEKIIIPEKKVLTFKPYKGLDIYKIKYC